MAHTEEHTNFSRAAPNWKVFLASPALILWIALASVILESGSALVDVPQNYSISMAQFDGRVGHDAANLTMVHCGKPCTCGSATLYIDPLAHFSKKSLAIIPAPKISALSWIAIPPRPPPKYERHHFTLPQNV